VRRLWTLTRMALHELWISFRLIPLVGLPVVGGMLAWCSAWHRPWRP